MRFITIFSLVGLFINLAPAAANFHVGFQKYAEKGTVRWTETIACPSNQYTCNCLGSTLFDIPGPGVDEGFGPSDDVVGELKNFSIQPGFCGQQQLNFYNQGNGHWQFYINNGNGQVQGNCYNNAAAGPPVGCGLTTYYERLVCYTSICGN